MKKTNDLGRPRSCLFAVSALALAISNTYAEERADDSRLEEVLVNGYVTDRSLTGSKMDLPIREIPQTISVVTADQIEMLSAQSLDQVLSYSAGVVPVTGGATSTTDEVFSLRGFDDRSNSTIYIDGSKVSRNIFSGTTEPYGIESVEVLKGPASALYGRAAPGGIINVVMKKPTVSPVREIQVQLGTNNRKQLAGDFGGALNSDQTWSYRLTGVYRESETDVDYIDDDRQFFAPSIRWQPSERTSLTLRAEFKSDETAYNYGLPFEGTVKDNPNGDIAANRFIGEPDFDKWNSDNVAISYQFEHEFSDTVTFRQNFHHFESEVDYAYISFGMFVPGVGSFIWADPEMTTIHRGFVERKDEDDGFSVDSHVEIRIDNDNLSTKLLLGYDTIEGDFERTQTRGILGSNPFDDTNTLSLYNPVYQPAITIPELGFRTIEGNGLEQQGIYFQSHTKVGKKWVISGGARRDEVTLKTDYTEPDTPYTESFSEDSDATTFNVGIVYLAEQGLSPYVSYSESFQPNVGLDESGEVFEPSKGDQVEIGLKYRPEGAKIQASISVFDIQQRDVVVNSFSGYSQGSQIDLGSAGFELETQAHLTDNLNLIASYTNVDAEVTKSSIPVEGHIRYQKGNKTAGQPSSSAFVWLDYKLPSLPGFLVGGGVRYVDETTDFTNEVNVPSYVVADLAIGYELDSWNFSLNVKNLTDKEYISACTYACWYGQGQTAIAKASYSW